MSSPSRTPRREEDGSRTPRPEEDVRRTPRRSARTPSRPVAEDAPTPRRTPGRRTPAPSDVRNIQKYFVCKYLFR